MGEKILIVDDEEPIRELLRNLIEQQGYEAILASNGEEAVRLAERENPDLIILDMIMPELDGTHACLALKANGKTRGIPIIVATGFVELVGVAMNAGVDDIVMKPVPLAELMVRVKALLRYVTSRTRLKEPWRTRRKSGERSLRDSSRKGTPPSHAR
jgi:DNA-binding response OmpR family regulator